ncbi:Hypothetical predicted protein [Cloeon dipterum]|uniref:Uncharacterized protein n=2 Tax=Cloeon dipterum TaxID=197152 RepID=A0A8S1CX54_9INSE|nr:Hypothetical predicted protein [Cloeon dipterum]
MVAPSVGHLIYKLVKLRIYCVMSENDRVNKMEPISLSEVAFETILKNIGRYKELITSIISPPVREMLGREMMEKVQELGPEQVWTAMSYLEPHKTTECFRLEDYRWILEMKPGQSAQLDHRVSLDELLRYLVQHAPNLKELDLEERRAFESKRRRLIGRRQLLEKSSIDLICQMKNLTRISMRYINVNFSAFVRICRVCEDLQEIEAKRVLADVHPNSMKKTLESLVSVFNHQEYYEVGFPGKFEIIFKKTNALDHCVKMRVWLIMLPLSGFMDSIPEITHLEFYGGRNSFEFHHILSKKGGNLKKLSLISVDPNMKITFKYIFEQCKSLETLHLNNSFIADDDAPINSFGKLKELNWNNGNYYDYPMKLHSILSAPLLGKIYISTKHFELGDKEALFDRIRNRVIMTNVREFLIRAWIYDDEPDPADLGELLSEIEANSLVPITTKLTIFRHLY